MQNAWGMSYTRFHGFQELRKISDIWGLHSGCTLPSCSDPCGAGAVTQRRLACRDALGELSMGRVIDGIMEKAHTDGNALLGLTMNMRPSPRDGDMWSQTGAALRLRLGSIARQLSRVLS
jgi:hypothetical protein